jgi:hypothetical protein
METFTKLFGSLLALVYHCFDRIVIQGYVPLLTRPEHMVHFFRDVHGLYPITKEVLAKRTNEYQRWVEAFARNHRIPIRWPDEGMKKKGVKKEDYVHPYCLSLERRKRFGPYFIFKSLEPGPTFRSVPPKFPTEDPDYRILKRNRSRYTHYYFYIRDEVLGPMVMCVGSFLPFQTTYYINGHHFIAGELQRQGVRFRKDDNAFLWTDNPQALQAAADRLSPEVIHKRLEYRTLVLGPQFSKKDRAAVPLRRDYSLNQVEYCRFTSSSSGPVSWACSASRRTRSRRSSASASTSEFAASCTACWRSSITDTMCCGSTARAWWLGGTKSSPPSCAWRSASTGLKIWA